MEETPASESPPAQAEVVEPPGVISEPQEEVAASEAEAVKPQEAPAAAQEAMQLPQESPASDAEAVQPPPAEAVELPPLPKEPGEEANEEAEVYASELEAQARAARPATPPKKPKEPEGEVGKKDSVPTGAVISLKKSSSLKDKSMTSKPSDGTKKLVSFGVEENLCAINITEPAEGLSIKPGEEIVGVVYLHITETVEASALQITMVGVEDSKVTYKQLVGDGRQRKRVAKKAINFSNFLFSRWDLAKFPDGEVLPGQYEFPFRYTLPDDQLRRPPSTFSQRMGKDSCEIRYYFEARLFKAGWFQFDMLAQKNFVLAVPIPDLGPPEPFEDDSVIYIKKWRCIPNGNMKVKASVNSTIFINGAHIEVHFEASNLSKTILTYITVELVERVWWGAANIKKSKRMRKESTEITQTLTFPADKLNDITGDRKMSSNQEPIVITVPSHFREDYSGELLGCDHFIRVSLKCDEKKRPVPRVVIPITVYDRNVAARLGPSPSVTLPAGLQDEEEDDDEEDFGNEAVAGDGLDKLPPKWAAKVALEADLSVLKMEGNTMRKSAVYTGPGLPGAIDDDEPTTFLQRISGRARTADEAAKD